MGGRWFRALASPNFRLYMIGQTVSLSGTWMQRVATGWLVYRLTASPFWLGLVEFASLFTAFLFAPLAGALADRWRRRDIFLVSQFVAGFQALLLWRLVTGGEPTVEAVLALTILLGLANGFEYPVRQSFFVELVDDRADLGNAIALNSLSFNVTRLLGPALGGLFIARWGEAPCFLFNAVSYLAAILMLAVMHLPDRRPGSSPRLRTDIAEGLRYCWDFLPVRHLMVLLALFGFSVLPVSGFLPVFARDILGGDARLLGTLTAAMGLGATVGAAWMLGRERVEGLERVIGGAALGYGICLIFFCLSSSVPFSLLLMALMGAAMILVWVPANTLLQAMIADSKRGRVMSLYIMCFMGAAPLGSLCLGALARFTGVPPVLAAGAVCCLFVAFRFLAHRTDFYPAGGSAIYRDRNQVPLREGFHHG